MSVDMGGSLITFLVLFPTALGVSYLFFYIKRELAIKAKRNKEA